MPDDFSDDVRFFIDFLRQHRLEWIADQLAGVIQEGKSDTKKVKKLKRDGVTTRPFTDREQEKILLDLLEAYFVTLPSLLLSAEAALNDSVKVTTDGSVRPVAIAVRELESNDNFEPYTTDLTRDTERLKELLAAARRVTASGA